VSQTLWGDTQRTSRFTRTALASGLVLGTSLLSGCIPAAIVAYGTYEAARVTAQAQLNAPIIAENRKKWEEVKRDSTVIAHYRATHNSLEGDRDGDFDICDVGQGVMFFDGGMRMFIIPYSSITGISTRENLLWNTTSLRLEVPELDSKQLYFFDRAKVRADYLQELIGDKIRETREAKARLGQ
jgi:hypothetical protein